jgi:EpsI family protein
MKKNIAVSLVLGTLMLSSAVAAHMLTPTRKPHDAAEQFDLKAMIPAAFGQWEIDDTIVPVQVDPALQRQLEGLYNQTLSRTYVNRDGQRVMLSMAYGGDQAGSLEMHRPEACYTAQGFAVSHITADQLRSQFGTFPLTRLIAATDRRHEPVSYWMTVGDRTIKNGLEQKLQKFRYMLTGKIPDGMLVRVSTIDTDEAASFRTQDAFVNELLAAMDARDRGRIVNFAARDSGDQPESAL